MADVFIEHMVKRRSDGKSLAVKLLIAVALLVAEMALFILLLITGGSMFMIVFLLMVGAIWGAIMLIRRRNFEFEYIVTNAELDVDKIIARRSRKRLLTVDCRKFDILAPMSQEFHNEYESASITKTLDASSSPLSERRWFAVFSDGDGGARTMLIFEPNERMLEAFRRYIPSKIKRA